MRRALRWSVILAALGFSYLAYVYLTLPDVRPLARENPDTTAFIQLRQREAEAAGREFRLRQQFVPYSRISSHLKRAVILTEDAAFWQHEGLDYDEIRAAIELNIAERRFARGASTITQQLAKNLYLSPSRNPVRKLRELVITRRLEAELSKQRIFELYLNVIEWGDGIFGCEAAARAYFGKSASALSPSEAALLAGAIINPRVHNPARPTRRLLARQRIILGRMGGVASSAEEAAAQAAPPARVRDELAVTEEAEQAEAGADVPAAEPDEAPAEPEAPPPQEVLPSTPVVPADPARPVQDPVMPAPPAQAAPGNRTPGPSGPPVT